MIKVNHEVNHISMQ